MRVGVDCAVELEGLSRTFGKRSKQVVALHDVNIRIGQGESVALLGENGAGKTTLTKILATLLFPSSGIARVFGHDVRKDPSAVRERISAIFGGDRGLYRMLSGRENLRYFGVLNGLSPRTVLARAEEALSSVGLDAAADRRVETYSKGMQQRLHVAIGLLTRPDLLLLDEPTVGLDPNEAARLRVVVKELTLTGTTVLLTSHNLTDVEQIAERVVMIAAGRITHDLPLHRFRGLSGATDVVSMTLSGPLPDRLPRGARVSVESGVATIAIFVQHWNTDVLAELTRLSEYGAQRITVRNTTLEDAFAVASMEDGARVLD